MIIRDDNYPSNIQKRSYQFFTGYIWKTDYATPLDGHSKISKLRLRHPPLQVPADEAMAVGTNAIGMIISFLPLFFSLFPIKEIPKIHHLNSFDTSNFTWFLWMFLDFCICPDRTKNI